MVKMKVFGVFQEPRCSLGMAEERARASGYRGAKRGAWECGILRAFVSTKDGLSYGREARDGDGGDGVGYRASLFAAVD